MRKLKAEGRQAVALIGGTFDPVHFGHLRTALEVKEQLQVEDFRFLPAGNPPHRDGPVSDALHRLAMLKLAVEGTPGFTIDERELNRAGPSYMAVTLRDLRGELGNCPLILVLGQDSANTLDSWFEWQSLFSLAHLAIMSRPGDEERYEPALHAEMDRRMAYSPADLLSCDAGLVMKIEVTRLPISSSRIRKLLRSSRSAQYLLPASVLDYIGTHNLYQSA